jgi:transposase
LTKRRTIIRKPLPHIQESIQELLALMRAQKDPRLRMRVHLLYLLKARIATTRRQAAHILGVHRKTVGQWLNTYQQQGLDALLVIGTHSNRELSIPESVLTALSEQLSQPEGFPSYKAVQHWLEEAHQLCLPYSTVHGIVRYQLKAKLKVGRRSHAKKDPNASKAFREELPDKLQQAIPQAQTRPVRVFSQDESRFGLILNPRRKLTLAGVKPITVVAHRFESYYLYGCVEPLTGEHFLLEMPALNATCFQVFLEEFAVSYADSFNVLVLDQGKFHQAGCLRLPENVGLVFLPAYSPELSPIERFWESLKDRIAHDWYDTLLAMKDGVAHQLKQHTNAIVRSLTGFGFVVQAAQQVC